MSKVVDQRPSDCQHYKRIRNFGRKLIILVTILYVNILPINRHFARAKEAFAGFVQYVKAECLSDGDGL